MPLQVLPPGVTALVARGTPSFGGAPLLPAPSSNNFGAYASVFMAAALSKDPRSVIAEQDLYPLRLWIKSLLGLSWRDDLTLDDVMRQSPRLLYKAVCLYLQGRYWGALPDDWTGDSNAAGSNTFNASPLRLTHEGGDAFGGSPGYNWPNAKSVSEQRIFKWNLKMVPTAAPMSHLAEDVNGAIYMPLIVPSMNLQKFDESTGGWRVLNLGGTDRDFMLDAPGGAWRMKGWDFGEWVATNATFLEIIKVVGFVVVAAAAVISGGAALAGGAALSAALATGLATAQTAQQLIGAAEQFLTAAVRGDLGSMLNGIASIVQRGFGVDLKSLATYQPGIDQLGSTFDTAVKPYVSMIKAGIGESTIGDVYRTVLDAGRTAEAFAAQADKLLIQFSNDASRIVTGLPPDLMLKALATASTNDVIQIATKIKADYTARASATIDSLKGQVPLYLDGWKEKGRLMVQQVGRQAAMANAVTIPWFGKTAYNAGTVIGAFEANMSLQSAPDINSLTAAQKRALFFGDIASVCGGDPNCLINAAEFLRQSDGFWGSIQQYADRYGLRK
jgi:hypothetical protein